MSEDTDEDDDDGPRCCSTNKVGHLPHLPAIVIFYYSLQNRVPWHFYRNNHHDEGRVDLYEVEAGETM